VFCYTAARPAAHTAGKKTVSTHFTSDAFIWILGVSRVQHFPTSTILHVRSSCGLITIMKQHGRPLGGKTGILHFIEIEAKSQKFLET